MSIRLTLAVGVLGITGAFTGTLASSSRATPITRASLQNGPLTLFLDPGDGVARIMTVNGKHGVIWHCPLKVFCGQPVSFAWDSSGRRVAFTLDEIGGNSAYVGLHVLNVTSGQDRRIPEGAPQTADITDPAVWAAYLKRMLHRVGCWPAANLAWSPDGSRLAYNCGPQIEVLELHGSGHMTLPTGTDAYWPAWSPTGTRIVYSTRLKPSHGSSVYTIALDGSHRRLIAGSGTAPAWSPDGRMIAYQTRCGIRLVTPSGHDRTPSATANSCGALGRSGPPVWSPDGKQLAFETNPPDTVMALAGTWVMDNSGRALRRVSGQATNTWYRAIPGRPSWRPMR